MKNILVIDDEPGIRELFAYILPSYGFKVTTCENGLAGIEQLKKEGFDLIFLDVHMPGMRGPEVLVEIKKLRPAQLVIVFSSSSDPTYVFESKAKEYGAFGCLYKPAGIDEILRAIEKALNIKLPIETTDRRPETGDPKQ